MSKRMQVLIDEAEYRRLQRAARRQGMTLAEWVRQVLRAACREVSATGPERKLAAIRAAARHSFPIGDIDQVNAEIERGYLGEAD